MSHLPPCLFRDVVRTIVPRGTIQPLIVPRGTFALAPMFHVEHPLPEHSPPLRLFHVEHSRSPIVPRGTSASPAPRPFHVGSSGSPLFHVEHPLPEHSPPLRLFHVEHSPRQLRLAIVPRGTSERSSSWPVFHVEHRASLRRDRRASPVVPRGTVQRALFDVEHSNSAHAPVVPRGTSAQPGATASELPTRPLFHVEQWPPLSRQAPRPPAFPRRCPPHTR